MSTQKERVLEHLNHFGCIQPLEALSQLGIYRLAAVIHLLKQDGHAITSTRVSVTNRWGEECNVARYTLTTAQLVDAAGQRSLFNVAS